MSVFKNQGYLTLKFDTGIDLTAASNKAILFKKPNGVKGSIDATVETTKLVISLVNATLNMAPGEWQFQPFCTFSGRNAYGDVYPLMVEENLS